jgi:hypothetical protein
MFAPLKTECERNDRDDAAAIDARLQCDDDATMPALERCHHNESVA